jgi:hypothetical protein
VAQLFSLGDITRYENMKPKIIAVIVILTLAYIATYIYTQPPSDARRYADLKQAGSRYQQTRSDSDRKRLETDKQALILSGYFVEVAIPVSDLHAKLAEVKTRLADTARQSEAYYEAKLDWTTNEVRLLCCKSDVSMWQKSLQDYQ